MWLLAITLTNLIITSSTATLDKCERTYHMNSIDQPIVDSLPVSWQKRYICIIFRRQPYHTMSVLNFQPTKCVKFPELNGQYEDYGEDYQLYRIGYWRDSACVGIKGNMTENVKAAFAIRKGLNIGGQIVAEVIYNVYLPLLGVCVALCSLVLFPWLKRSQLFTEQANKAQ